MAVDRLRRRSLQSRRRRRHADRGIQQNREGPQPGRRRDGRHEGADALARRAGRQNRENPSRPHKTGRLAGSIRAGRGKTKAVVTAGRKSIPYAGVQHYGWPAHHIKSSMFLVKALEARNEDIVRTLVKGIGEICTKLGLENNIGGLNV